MAFHNDMHLAKEISDLAQGVVLVRHAYTSGLGMVDRSGQTLD